MKLKVNAKLDSKFQPLSLICRDMREATKEEGQDLVIAIERNKGYTTTYKTYTYEGLRAFDVKFMERVYETKFEVVVCDMADAPKDKSACN